MFFTEYPHSVLTILDSCIQSHSKVMMWAVLKWKKISGHTSLFHMYIIDRQPVPANHQVIVCVLNVYGE